jgi:hypothetical protein
MSARHRHIALVILSLTIGCRPVDEIGSRSAAEEGDGDGVQHHNGRSRLGFDLTLVGLPNVEVVGFGPITLYDAYGAHTLLNVHFQQGGLVADDPGYRFRWPPQRWTQTPADLNNASVMVTAYTSDRQSVSLWIRHVTAPDPKTGDTHWHYDIGRPVNGQWKSACAVPPSIDPAYPSDPQPTAIAVPGLWGTALPQYYTDGEHGHLDTDYTFACSSGVVNKCTYWGYDPTQSQSLTPDGGAPATTSGVQIFDNCTHLAQADYCGDNVSHTKDGTRIRVYDIFNPLPAHQPGYRFEAVWGLSQTQQIDGIYSWSGATCVSALRIAALPANACLTHVAAQRNAAINLPTNPNPLLDPRYDSSGAAFFCEEIAQTDLGNMNKLITANEMLPGVLEPTLRQQGGVLFDDSVYPEWGLYSYSYCAATSNCLQPANRELLSTSGVVPLHRGQIPVTRPGFNFSQDDLPTPHPEWESQQQIFFEGAVLDPAFATPPAGMVMLQRYRCPRGAGVSFVTTAQPAPIALGACTLLHDEGYVYASDPGGAASLTLWYNSSRNEYRTTHLPPRTPPGEWVALATWYLVN